MPTREEMIAALKEQDQKSIPSREEMIAALKEQDLKSSKPLITPEGVETGVRSALASATLGVSEPVISGVNAVLGNLIESGFDANSATEAVKMALDPERIKAQYQADVQRREELQSAHPVADIGGSIAGAFAPSPISLAGKVTEGISGLAGAAKGAAKLVTSPLAGAAKAVAPVAIQGAVESAAGFQPDNIDLEQAAKMGAGIEMAASAIPVAGKAVGKMGKAILASVGGVNPKVIDAYLAEAPSIQGALEKPELKAKVDQAIGAVQEDLIGKKADLADNLVTGIKTLKEKVKAGSRNAYSILDQEAGTLPKALISDAIEGQKKSFRVGGVIIGPSAKEAEKILGSLAKDIEALPEEIPLAQAKQILQHLDDSIDFAQNVGGFGTTADKSLSSIRRVIDQYIKNKSPLYKQAMEVVADDTQLLSDLSQKIGDREGAFKAVNQVVAGTNVPFMEQLSELEKRTGMPISKQAEILRQGTPIAKLKTDQTQSIIEQVMADRSVSAKEKLKTLSMMVREMPEEQIQDFMMDYAEEARKTGIKSAFDKEFRQGSGNVNFWSIMGMGILGSAGAAIGESALGGVGMGGGAVLGALATKYGPQATKKLLDLGVQIQGVPTVQKIQKGLSSLGKAAQGPILNDFEVVAGKLSREKMVDINEEDIGPVTIDIMRSKELSSIEKAKAIQSLKATNEIPGDVISALMLGKKTPKVEMVDRVLELKRLEDKKNREKPNNPAVLRNVGDAQQFRRPQ